MFARLRSFINTSLGKLRPDSSLPRKRGHFVSGRQTSDARRILVITGPTASGKTEHALKLAEQDPTIEIVNADAFLVYRGFDIGTAKPSQEEMQHVPHHLIDIREPHEEFNAADYSRLARDCIREIIARGKTPVVVGGTGLYIDALFNGLMDVSHDMTEGRERARREIEEFGFEEMLRRLEPIDPDLYQQTRREGNPLRLQRAWEHYYATGEALGKTRKENKPQPFEYEPECKVMSVPRPEIWKRIEQRVDRMIARGWPLEAERLMRKGVTRDMPAMRAIGYREMCDVADKQLTIAEARERIIVRTRQYAKRQGTWMKRYLSEP
jgi:tRNA dimethylallyltransferase